MESRTEWRTGERKKNKLYEFVTSGVRNTQPLRENDIMAPTLIARKKRNPVRYIYLSRISLRAVPARDFSSQDKNTTTDSET